MYLQDLKLRNSKATNKPAGQLLANGDDQVKPIEAVEELKKYWKRDAKHFREKLQSREDFKAWERSRGDTADSALPHVDGLRLLQQEVTPVDSSQTTADSGSGAGASHHQCSCSSSHAGPSPEYPSDSAYGSPPPYSVDDFSNRGSSRKR